MVIQRKYHGVQCCCGLGQPNGRKAAETADFQYRTQWRRIDPPFKQLSALIFGEKSTNVGRWGLGHKRGGHVRLRVVRW